MFTGDLSPLQRNTLRAAVNVDISMCGAISFSHHGSLIHSAHHYSTRFFSSYIYGIDEYFAFTIIFTNSPLSCCLSGWVYNFNSFKFSWVLFLPCLTLFITYPVNLSSLVPGHCLHFFFCLTATPLFSWWSLPILPVPLHYFITSVQV